MTVSQLDLLLYGKRAITSRISAVEQAVRDVRGSVTEGPTGLDTSITRPNLLSNSSFEFYNRGESTPVDWSISGGVTQNTTAANADGVSTLVLPASSTVQQAISNSTILPQGAFVLSVVARAAAAGRKLTLTVSHIPGVQYGTLMRTDGSGYAVASNEVPADGQWYRFYVSGIIVGGAVLTAVIGTTSDSTGTVEIDAAKFEFAVGAGTFIEPTAYQSDDRGVATNIRNFRAENIVTGTLIVGGDGVDAPLISVRNDTNVEIVTIGSPAGGNYGIEVLEAAGILVSGSGSIVISGTGSVGVTGGGSINLTGGGALNVGSSGGINVSGGGNITVGSNGEVIVSGTGRFRAGPLTGYHAELAEGGLSLFKGGTTGGTMPTFVVASSVSTATATSIQKTPPTGVAQGDLMIAQFTAQANSTTLGASGWNLITGTNLTATPTTPDTQTAFYWRIAGATELSPYTFTSSVSGVLGISISIFRGVDQTTPINASAGQVNASSVTITAPTITTTRENVLLALLAVEPSDQGITVSGALTERWDNQGPSTIRHYGATEAFATPGATGTRTATIAAARDNIGALIAIQPPLVPIATQTILLSSITGKVHVFDDSFELEDGGKLTFVSGLVWSDNKGMWAINASGQAAFAVSGTDGNNWGNIGQLIDKGDVLIGNNSSYVLWDSSASKLIISGELVVGTTDKLWLNDGGDGSLAIGGATKASAPFRVTAAGALTATNVTITGTINANGGTIPGSLTITGSGKFIAGNTSVGATGIDIIAASGALAGANALRFRNSGDTFDMVYFGGYDGVSNTYGDITVKTNGAGTLRPGLRLGAEGYTSGGGLARPATITIFGGNTSALGNTIDLSADTVSVGASGAQVYLNNKATVGSYGGSVGTGELGVASYIRTGTGTSASGLELGSGGSGNRSVNIDFIADATYTDYALRIIRTNAGANATSEIDHRGTGPFNLATIDAAPLNFYTSSNLRMVIASSGEVGVGVAAASGVRLHVMGPGTTSATYSLSTKNSSNTNIMYTRDDGLVWVNQAWTVGSDARLKQNISPLRKTLKDVLRVTGHSYQLKIDESGRLRYGVVAQEIERILPDLVSVSEDGTLGVDYQGLGVLTLTALQEAYAELKGELRQVWRKLRDLEARG